MLCSSVSIVKKALEGADSVVRPKGLGLERPPRVFIELFGRRLSKELRSTPASR